MPETKGKVKISIVTISFNQVHFLERCIRSVVEQNYNDIEYIIVDPGSTDGSREVIEKYRNSISKIIYEPDEGPADGLNKGFSVATGKIFGYLNSDDAFLPGTLRKVAESFMRYPDADVIFGHGYIVDPKGFIIRRFFSDHFTPWRYVHRSAYVMQQSTFFRNESFHSIGGFNKHNMICWDSELLLDFALAGMEMRVINDFWSIFTIHDQSITGQVGKKSDLALRIENDRKINSLREYKKVMEYEFNVWSRCFILFSRFQRRILQPRATFWRIAEKLGFRTRRNINDLLN